MKMNLSNIPIKVKKFTQKHSSEILISLGIISGATAVVAAIKVTPKAVILIDEKKKQIDTGKLTITETIKTTWKCYIPVAVAEAFSVAFLVCAATTNNKHNAALTAAYALSEQALNEYRDKVIETIGEKKEKKIRDDIAKDKIVENPPSKTELIAPSTGDQLCYDALSGRYFQSNSEKIRRAQNKVNNDMLSNFDGCASLNDFYYELGLSDTKLGDEIGWENMKNGLIDVEFSVQLASDDIPCLVLDFGTNPPTYFSMH